MERRKYYCRKERESGTQENSRKNLLRILQNAVMFKQVFLFFLLQFNQTFTL